MGWALQGDNYDLTYYHDSSPSLTAVGAFPRARPVCVALSESLLGTVFWCFMFAGVRAGVVAAA